MVQLHSNIVGIDAAIFMHPTTWKASGHVDAFNDPLIDNKDSKKRYRADVLVEDYCAKIEVKIEKEVKKAAKRFGESFDKAQFISTNLRVLGYQEKIDTILKRLGQSLEKEDLADVKSLIEELEIACPESGSRNWTDVKQFNLMFGTNTSICKNQRWICIYALKQHKEFLSISSMYKNRTLENSFWNCTNREGL